MSSPEARGLTAEWIAEHGDPDRDDYIPVDPPHWREQEEALDQFLAEHPSPDYGPASRDDRAGPEVPFNRARFDESLELARDQLAFPLPDRETDDEERER